MTVTGAIKAGIIVKKHWKTILIAIFIILFIPIVIATSFTVVKSVPAIDDARMRLYIETAETVGKDKTRIDWRNLIAIDSVRYKQDFSKANSNNVRELANRFIKENREVTKYDFNKYKSIVAEVNKKNSISIDWRYVVMVDSILRNSDFSNINDTSIRNLVNKFYTKNQIPEEYQELEKYQELEEYQEWESYFGLPDWLTEIVGLGRWVTKTRMVEKERYITKIRYKEGISVKSWENVLIDLGHNKNEVPEFFKNVNSINVTMEKVIITYTTKSLDEVLNEMNFSEEEKRDINNYKDIGLSLLISGDSYGGNGGYKYDGESNPIKLSQSEFIEKVSIGAIQGYKEYGVFPSITIAQAILESGWGKSGLTAKANNLFGIKAYNWNGPYVEMLTNEYYGGVKSTITARFRAYNSWDDSILDHGRFLKVNKRYTQHGVFSSNDYIEQAFAIRKAGYATDPNYPVMLINLIDKYNLNKYDSI